MTSGVRARRLSMAVLAAAVAVVGCASPEEKLVDRRQKLRATLDRTYAAYASAGADERPPTDADRTDPAAGLVKRFVDEIDRSHFESYCLASGRGERAFALSGRLEAFLREDANAESCRRAARIEAEVAALEREVAARRATAPR